jgi:hypothetical protein
MSEPTSLAGARSSAASFVGLRVAAVTGARVGAREFGNSLHGITSEKWSIAHTLITVAALVALLNSGNYQSDNG